MNDQHLTTDGADQPPRALTLRTPTPEEISQAALPARYEAARTAIAECERIDELKDLADRQAALAAYARQAKDDSLRLLALRIQARAERRVGELLKQIPRADEATRFGQAGTAPPVTRTSAAAAAGLSDRQRKTAVRIANVPEPEFERQVESDHPPTVTRLAQLGTSSRAVAMGAVTRSVTGDASETHDALQAFAAFCANHDAAVCGRATSPPNAEAARKLIGRIDSWIEGFLAHLARSNAGAA